MFLAIIIPPARKDKVVLVLIIISFAASYLCSRLPVIRDISGGTRTIILTLIIAGIAAWRFPPQTEITLENADAQKNRGGRMSGNIYIYIAIVAITSYLIRVLPLTLIRKPIKTGLSVLSCIMYLMSHSRL